MTQLSNRRLQASVMRYGYPHTHTPWPHKQNNKTTNKFDITGGKGRTDVRATKGASVAETVGINASSHWLFPIVSAGRALTLTEYTLRDKELSHYDSNSAIPLSRTLLRPHPKPYKRRRFLSFNTPGSFPRGFLTYVRNNHLNFNWKSPAGAVKEIVFSF